MARKNNVPNQIFVTSLLTILLVVLLFSTLLVLFLFIHKGAAKTPYEKQQEKIAQESKKYLDNPDLYPQYDGKPARYSLTPATTEGYTVLTSQDANFSITFPSWLRVYDIASEPEEFQGKQLFFCTNDINRADDIGFSDHCSEGLMIWYDGDGWGGGCDPEMQSSFTVLGENKTICESDMHFGGLRVDSKTHRFLIHGRYGAQFTPQIARQMVESFALIED